MSNIWDFLIGDSPALEADDITERVAQQMNGGGQSETAAATGEDRKEDLTQTDNIFDDATDPNDGKDTDKTNNQPDNPPQEETQEDTDAADQLDNVTEENPLERNDTPTDDAPTDEGDTSESGTNEDTAASVFSDKNTLKKNAITLINILGTNIESLSSSLGGLDDLSDIRCCNAVIANLSRTREILMTMVTKEMSTKSYEELMTVYVTAKRIYDVSIEMLNKHFIKDRRSKTPLNSRRSHREQV